MGDDSMPYEGYDVLDKWHTPSWNTATRQVVERRLRDVPVRRFFSRDEWETLEAVCDRLIPQPDRPGAQVPIVPFLDRELVRGDGRGYRYADMPDLPAAWRLGLYGIEREAHRRHGTAFRDLDPPRRDSVLRTIQRGDVSGEPWRVLPPRRFFADLLLRSVVRVYYAHPSAWSEIGFGGPASPRGYVRLGFDQRDPWEAKERLRRDDHEHE